MTLYVTPIGLAIASVFWLVAALAMLGPVWRRLKNKSYRWALFGPLLAAVLVLPYSDELWIAWHFYQLCKDAGVHVVRKVEVEGFYDQTLRSGYELMNRLDYRFMEHPAEEKGKVAHIARLSGSLRETLLDRPTARYHYRFADERHAVPAWFQIEKGERQVVDTESNEVIARETWYNRYPGLVEGLWMRLFGKGMSQCPDPGKSPPTRAPSHCCIAACNKTVREKRNVKH